MSRACSANLLSNASKFSHSGAKVVICTEVGPETARILVIDEGIGLSEETKVFEEFSQVDSSDKRAVGGTGLGINISRRIVEAMDGSIDYRRNEHVGTTFYVDLPLHGARRHGAEVTNVCAESTPLSWFLKSMRNKSLGGPRAPRPGGGEEKAG